MPMADHRLKAEISYAGRFTSSGIVACFAKICTIPLDTAKVRLLLQKKAAADATAVPKYRGMLGTVATIAREEGAAALWKGIVPGLHRQCVFGELRMGYTNLSGLSKSAKIMWEKFLCPRKFLPGL